MICHNVNNNLDAIGMSSLAHSLELFLGTELIVADGIVGGLILIVPFTVTVKLHTAVVALYDLIDRRGLNSREACFGDFRNIILNRVEVPAPAVQDKSLLDILWQGLLLVRGRCGGD